MYVLPDILTTAIGFPEECCVPQRWVPTGEDPMLDLVVALMCYGLYPNVCLHQGKRKVTDIYTYNKIVEYLFIENIEEKHI